MSNVSQLEYEILPDGTLCITESEDVAGDLVIPAQIDGRPVTVIGARAFEANGELTSVTLPEGLTEIQRHAFCECESLCSIRLPSTLRCIGSSAFRACSLTELTLPEGIEMIGETAFEGCEQLQALTLPDSLRILGPEAFSGCTGLEKAHIGSGVVCGGEPDSDEEFSFCSAFNECTALREVTFSEGATVVGSAAFDQCTALTDVRLPASMRRIADCAFRGCRALTALTLPEGVEAIDAYAFTHCTQLRELTLPASLRQIASAGVLHNNPPELVVRAPRDSYAASWAQAQGLRFEAAD